jgi:hypothetical protein
MRGMSGPARLVVAGIAISLVATATAVAAPPPGSSLLDRRIYYADQAIEQAGKKVERDHACRQRPPEPGPVDAAPSAEFLNSLAALRRPARPDEDVDFPVPLPHIPSVYRGYARELTAADGTTFQVFPMHDVSRAQPRPKRCVSELRRRIHRTIADRPRGFRQVARRELQREISNYWAPRQREGMLVFVGHTAGTMVDLALFQSSGVLFTGGGVYGLVPDGVATIDFTFRRLEPTGYWSKHHPVTYRATVAVQDNVISFNPMLALRDSWVARQIWRAADGHVIRVISG